MADGVDGRGGIERINRFLIRQLSRTSPGSDFRVQRTRFGQSKALRHLSVPIALIQFSVRCVFGRVDGAHINVAPRGSTWRKMVFAEIGKLFGVPYLIHLHGGGYPVWFADRGAFARKLVARFFGRADQVLVLGEEGRDFVVTALGLEAAKVQIVANGVPEPAAIASPSSSRAKLVFLGHLTRRKGFDVLLEALGVLAGEGLDFELVAGGDGDLDGWLASAKDLGLDGRVQLLGWVEEDTVDRVLREADIFVLPSLVENQPISILEAMARAVPVVASDVGTIRQTVGDGAAGLIVQAGSSADLASALRTLIEDPDRRAELGLEGRRRWQDKYSIEAVAKQMACCYAELTNSQNR